MHFSSAPSGNPAGVLRPANIFILWYAVLFLWALAGRKAVIAPVQQNAALAHAPLSRIGDPLRTSNGTESAFTSDIWEKRREEPKRKRTR